MSAWLRRFTTLLLITLASVCEGTPARAWEAKTAHRGLETAIAIAATETAALSASRDREKSSLNRWTASNPSVARYYDPNTARFTTEDPEAGKDLEPPSLHRYLYAYANPTAYIDPNGRQTYSVEAANARARSLLPDDAAKQEFDRNAATLATARENQRQEFNGLASGTTDVIGNSIYEGIKFGGRLAAAMLFDVGGNEVMDDLARGVNKTADAISGGPVMLADYWGAKSAQAEALREQGKHAEAGRLWAPEGAAIVSTFTGTTLSLAKKSSSASATVVESANGKPALHSSAPPISTWNEFQAETRGRYASREEAGLAYKTYKRLESLGNDIPQGVAFEGQMHRYEMPDRIATTWNTHKWNIGANHRYTGPGQGGVYGGASEKVALAEVSHYGVEAGRIPINRQARLPNTLDLTDPSTLRQLGVPREQITGNSYAVTQQIGAWAKRRGYDGIIAPSARDSSGANVISFSSIPEEQ